MQISLGSIEQKAIQMFKRFPISVLLIVIYTVMLIIMTNNKMDNIFELNYLLHVFFTFSISISIVSILLLEDFISYKKQHIITAAAVLLYGVYCLFLPDVKSITPSKLIEIIAIGQTAFLSIFFISFLKKGKDVMFWNFASEVFFQLCLAIFFSTIVSIGIVIAFYAIGVLFGAENTPMFIFEVPLICNALFSFYFLANIPSGEAKHSENVRFDKHIRIFALYILMPLAAIYAIILYIYLLKIVFTWELPEGLVSYLVSALACVGLMIITFLRPITINERSRYLCLLMLPLLALMTVGILYRINEYGITILRCYVLLANLWFYGIFIYLFITKLRSIRWIFVSFSAILLLSSIGFWSIPNITKHILLAEVKNSTPITKEETKKHESKKSYLTEMYGDSILLH